jgi:CheY-like chemotaxis protein
MFGEAVEGALLILVVEDDQSIQSIVEEALRDGGSRRHRYDHACRREKDAA